ncbi:hypothetical protein SAMN04488134_11341 [Amphibacillus marinus]|uniref:Uncharacterized protein n=1 Tax=Amphibacillus marinus TaxID=872970 RepID=A0A1H8SNW4_9BACI|nr:hypothetical protein [Amphibacillus marinus]SEO79863.1 hypothetical protein SAMN04488134_11341 [Amphibacillus marinus]
MKRLTFLFLIIALTFVLLNFELQSIKNSYLSTFWLNLQFISTGLYMIIPLILLTGLLLLLFTNKWALRVEKMNIGGFNIIFDNPAYLYKKQIRNYLDTKRTIFKVNFEYDNFSETIDSYFEIYKFFRDEIKILGDTGKKRFRNNDAIFLYNLTNQTIRILNSFLTENQSNYRRWYTYINKNDQKNYYLTPIGELQKQYPYYDKICSEFEIVNNFFVNKIADEFGVDIEKWSLNLKKEK